MTETLAAEAAAPSRGHLLSVAQVIRESADSVSIVFDVQDGDRARFGYRPGQFLTLQIPSERTGSVSRCYSISSSPHVDAELQVTVKRMPDGYASNWLCDTVAPGQHLRVLPPSGVFVPDSLDADLLLFAGGSGITPVISILKSALAQGSGRLLLVYANRDERSVIFAAELRRLAERYADRLTIIHWLESVQGQPTQRQLQLLAAPFAAYESFTCGPAPFIAAVTGALEQLGIPRDRRNIEVFTSLSGDSFAERKRRVAAATATPPSDVADGDVLARQSVPKGGDVPVEF